MTYPYENQPYFGMNEYLLFRNSYSLQEILLKYELEIINICKQYSNVYLLSINRTFESIGKKDNFRLDYGWGHPTRDGGVLIAENFISQACSIDTTQRRIKCIVVDCDNTLWKGVIRDIGPKKIHLYRDKIAALYTYSQRGIPIVVASKNNPGNLKEIKGVLKQTPGFLRSIVYWCVNWNPKSQNILKASEVLNIPIKNMAFFDDNPFERDEVSANCPGIHVFKDTHIINSGYGFRFQPLGNITSASGSITQMYQENVKRHNDMELSVNNADNKEVYHKYLETCNFELTISLAQESDLGRVQEIFSRTNQLNATYKRTTQAELNEYFINKDYSIFVGRLEDKFGDYNIIGACILKVIDGKNEIIELSFSCRAMGKSIEKTFIVYLAKYSASNKKDLTMGIVKNERNHQIIEILKELSFIETKENNMSRPFNLESEHYPTWVKVIEPHIE